MVSNVWRTRKDHEPSVQKCICPYCNMTIAGKIMHVIEREYFPCQNEPIFYVLSCPSCRLPIIYHIKYQSTHPSGKSLRTVLNLPPKIDAVYQEVSTAIGANCYTAAVILARTAINHIAVNKGAEPNRSFQHYVQYLVDNHFVPPNAHGWIDKIRTMANESVHDLEVWGQDEAESIGKFLMYLLIFIYELPSSVE